MQTLEISNSQPQSEGLLKRLFWPSIQNATDVDSLGVQGYWVCAIVAGVSLIIALLTGSYFTGGIAAVLFYLGGVGVREHSRYAAATVLAFYGIGNFTKPSILGFFITVLLLSNLRATWMASRWQPGSGEGEAPPRLSETWGDKFADKLPARLWPRVRIVYYILSSAFLVLLVIGVAAQLSRR